MYSEHKNYGTFAPKNNTISNLFFSYAEINEMVLYTDFVIIDSDDFV